MNTVPCPNCGCRCKVLAAAAGKKVKCPRCATPFPIPAAEAAPSQSQPSRAGQPALQAQEVPAAETVPEAAEGRSVLPIVLIAVGIVVALFVASAGGGLLVWLLLLRAPAPPAAPPAPVAAANNEVKQAAKGPSPQEIQAQKELQAARRRSVKNLKSLALAFQNYNDTFAQCPPAMSVRWQHPPPKNQPPRKELLLSWRVFLLPFVEEQQLFNQFKLDEPWDSPNNKKLLAKMPKIYAPVRGTTPEPGMTYYQVFVGENTPFLPAERLMPSPPGSMALGGPRIPASILDGTSNTFLVVEGGEPVPWTKPADLPYDAKKPLPKLGGLFADGFHAAAFDGSVYFIRRDFKEKDLRLMVTCNDGEPLSRDAVLTPLSEKDSDDEAKDGGAKAVAELVTIRGKVSYQDQPLTEGVVHFVGAKTFQTFSARIAVDGRYELRNVPAGVYKVAIKVNAPKNRMPEPKKGVGVAPPPENKAHASQIPIPTRYGNPDTSGIRREVMKGEPDFDIRLN